eukprot:3545606-Prymnesium_polylepis.1
MCGRALFSVLGVGVISQSGSGVWPAAAALPPRDRATTVVVRRTRDVFYFACFTLPNFVKPRHQPSCTPTPSAVL